jgi:hypothetical protein
VNNEAKDMSWSQCEPTLEEILSDPIVAAVMEADAVDTDELDALLQRVANGLRQAQSEDHSLVRAS